MFSNNKYDFFGRQKGEENPFMGAFDHDGLKRSSGVRPVRDDLREAAPMLPDTSNFSGDKDKDGPVNGRPPHKEFPWFGTPFHNSTYVSSPNPDGENEFSEDSDYVGSDDFDVEDVGLDDSSGVFNAKELREEGNRYLTERELLEEGERFMRDKGGRGLKIGDEKEECGGLSIRPANVSRETKRAQYEFDTEGEDIQNERARMREEGLGHKNPEELRLHNAIAEIRMCENLSPEAKEIAIESILGKTSQSGNVVSSVTRSLEKESKLPEKEKKHLGDYWLSVYPKKYTEEMVDDCEVKKKDRIKNS